MYIIKPVQYKDGTNSLTVFMEEIKEKYKGQEEEYLGPFYKLLKDFQLEGPLINRTHSKTFQPFKKLDDIEKNLSELRTYKLRYFIYQIDKYEWLGFHGYVKQGNQMPKNEKKRIKGEIKAWKREMKR